jgi:decaprenyl-phosphate phosphoribosyltransferase
MVKNIALLLRIEQWIKNILVFSPAFFASRLYPENLVKCFILFIAFSLVASAVYIVNDLNDVEKDKLHEKKKHRAVAAGKVTKKLALVIFFICLVFGMLLSIIVSVDCFYVLLIYFANNLLYSLWLKKIALLDLIIVSSGFLLRVFAGGLAVNVHLSIWLILITFLLSVFILFAKRRDDLVITDKTSTVVRDAIAGYNFEFVNAGMLITASVLIVAYIMYCLSPDSLQRNNGQHLYLSSFLVIIGVLRYLQITFVFNKSGNPIQVLLKDRFLQLLVIGWVIFIYILLYI